MGIMNKMFSTNETDIQKTPFSCVLPDCEAMRAIKPARVRKRRKPRTTYLFKPISFRAATKKKRRRKRRAKRPGHHLGLNNPFGQKRRGHTSPTCKPGSPPKYRVDLTRGAHGVMLWSFHTCQVSTPGPGHYVGMYSSFGKKSFSTRLVNTAAS